MIDTLTPYPAYKESGLPWLGQVPEHWEVRRAKFLLSEIDTRSHFGTEQLLRVSQYTGVTQRKSLDGSDAPDTRASSLIGYKLVEPDDLVINIMLAWNGSMGVSRYSGIASPAYCVYRFKKVALPWYFHELLRTPIYKQRIKTASTGVVESRLRLYSDDLGRLELPLPPPAEQAAIVRFLDWAGGRLERTIRAKRKIIALLNEQKQAIIHRAVTRGLDPHVPLKDSGIPWLGEIPAHWEVERTKNLFRLRTQKSGLNHGKELLSVYTYIGVRPRKDLEQKGNKASTTDNYWVVCKGDLVVNKLLAWMGAIGSSNYEGVTSPAYDILMPIRTLNSEYYHHLFRTKLYLHAFKQRSRGIMNMRLRLYFDQLGQIPIPIPPIEEQVAIIEFYEQNTSELTTTISRLEREIELLREYRTRLISDVVTGKLDVRVAAASLPAEPSIDSLATDLDALEDDTVDALDATEEDV
jgi:type I restriction enzyme S subunit